jgi:hypothetical protein
MQFFEWKPIFCQFTGQQSGTATWIKYFVSIMNFYSLQKFMMCMASGKVSSFFHSGKPAGCNYRVSDIA